MNQTWTNTSTYGRFTISRETFTQKSCKFAIPKWDMRHALL